MKYKIAICILILALLSGFVGCGGGGSGAEITYMLTDDTGNTYVAWRMVRSAGDQDVHLTKISSTGEALWDKALFIGDDKRVNISGLASDNNGGVFVSWRVLVPENGKEGPHNFTRHTITHVDGQANITMSCDFSERGIQIASDGYGGVLLWRSVLENYRIERMDNNGTTVWEYQLKSNQFYHQFIAGKDGRSFVFSATPGDTYATLRKIDASGQDAWGEEGVDVHMPPWTASSGNTLPIISDNKGGVFIVWTAMVSGEIKSEIGILHVNADGVLVYRGTLYTSSTPINRIKSLADDSGGCVIVWEDHRDGMALYAQKVDGEGRPLWQYGGVAVCTGLPLVSPFYQVADDGSGGVIIVWRDGRSRLTAQRLDADGQPQWGEEGVQIDNSACDWDILVSGDGQDGITIGWPTGRWEYSPEESHVQMINSEGTLLWGDKGIEISVGRNDNEE